MKINTSIGEVYDKISILLIKLIKIDDDLKKNHIKREISELTQSVNVFAVDVQEYFTELLVINSKLWDIEDRIREKEDKQEFDAEFIDLARGVYKTNDKRFLVKEKINKLFNSSINEVKSYKGVSV
jgi:hypothetical protein